jgi:glycerophosphoryl diester phosphodiesterase
LRRAPGDRAPRTGRGGPPWLLFAHRGACARAPENTLAAFEAAIRLGADAIECDVRLTRDGVPIVIHDDTVDRTTDGRGAVGEMTLPEIRRLDAGSWFAPPCPGERIPTLDETLALARGRCGLNLELKMEDSARRGAPEPGPLVEAVARALRRARFRDLLVLSSFAPAALVCARAVLPRVRIGFLASRSARRLFALHRRLGLFAFHPHHRIASRRRIAAAHARGLAVYVWPVNAPALARRLVLQGADGLMTDDPALLADRRTA